MKNRLIIVKPGAYFLIALMLTGCVRGFYKYDFDNARLKQEWQKSNDIICKSYEQTNHIVVHTGSEMKTLRYIRLNNSGDSIIAIANEYKGDPLDLYMKVLSKRNGKAYRPLKVHVNNAQQIHLFVNSYSIGNSNEIMFSTNDLYQVDQMKQATLSNSAANAAIIGGTAAAGIGVFVLVACNCPHVYMHNGTEMVFNNTLFTGAIAPQLERADYKLVPDYFSDSTQLSMKIVNEEKEDQFTNQLELVAVLHDSNMQVFPDRSGKLHTISNINSPVQADDNTNSSVLYALEKADDITFQFDPKQFKDLAEVNVKFDAKNQTNDAKLVIKAKNTLWSGYVYRQFNQLFGENYAKWVEANKDKTKEEREKWMREQGIKLLVEVKQDGKWIPFDEVDLIGEQSFNTVVIPIKRDLFADELEVRLRSGYQFWEVDYIGVDFSQNLPLETQVFYPSSAVDSTGMDFKEALRFDDEQYMKHVYTDKSLTTDVVFTGLPVDKSRTRTLILMSKGYYDTKSNYSGKTERKELLAFKKPGQLSRFSSELYLKMMSQLVTN